MRYEQLCSEAANQHVRVFERPMSKKTKGFYADNIIWINEYISTSVEKLCVLSEELGHHHTSSGDIIDQSILSNRKQELRARRWGYEYLIPLSRIIEVGQAGVEGIHDVAEYLEVTEEFLKMTIEHYQRKFGLLTVHDGYLIYFEPLTITKI